MSTATTLRRAATRALSAAPAAAAVVVLLGGSGTASAQVSEFTWTPGGSPAGTTMVFPDSLHIVGPDFPGFCPGDTTWLETVAPTDGTVTALAVFDNMDFGGCHYDAPAYVIDGVVFKAPTSSSCWGDGTYELSFEVQAGQHFGFGVWSADCIEGPGVVDIEDFAFVTAGWKRLGHALDPRLGAVWDGAAPEGAFGAAVAGLGDLDGDDVPDVAVGAPLEGAAGVVRVLSGADGSLIHELSGGTADARFGAAVADAGDADGDGTRDIAVGAPFHSPPGLTSAGRVAVYSGATGGLLWGRDGEAFAGFLGWAVAGFGDLDGDGSDDVLAGQPLNSSGDFAKAFVLSGADGSTLLTSTSGTQMDRMGVSVARIDDVTGDGVADLVLGAPHTSSPQVLNPFVPSEVHIASGATGAIVRTIPSNGGFGYAVAVVPDLDGDALPDLAVGTPSAPDGTNQRVGKVTLHSSVTGAQHGVAFGAIVDGHFGAALAHGGDLDDDGLPELAVGAPQFQADAIHGVVTLHRLPSMAVVAQLRAEGDALGSSLARVDDTDGDGLDELLVGGPEGGAAGVGRVLLYDELDRINPPRLDGSGPLSPGTPLTISIAKAPASSPAWFVIGLAEASLPFKAGVLVPQPQILIVLVTGPAGTLSLGATWPAVQPFWTTLWMQLWMPHPDGPAGWIASEGLSASGNV